MDKRLTELQNLTQMALDVEMMKLQRIAAAEMEKANQIKALDILAAERVTDLAQTGSTDAAQYAGADVRWGRWTQQKKAALNIERAALWAKHEEQRQKTQRAFGKDEAVGRLIDQAVEEIKMDSNRA